MDATTVGVVFSTSIEVTQLLPQHTDRTLLWFAAVKNGTTIRYTTKSTTVKAVPTPPATNVWLESAILHLLGKMDPKLAGLYAPEVVKVKRKRAKRGGARTTAEAVTGVLMHPKDTIEDFKSFFTSLANIWNNGNVGEGLRKHGVAATNLVVKYLPLAGAPGFAAAKALEKLQVTKWINLLATLIDFVTGKGNIMNFLNALKELVGDIFNILKEVILDFFKDPSKVGNAILGATTELGNTIVGAFDPAFAAQQEAQRKDQRLRDEEVRIVDEYIAMSIEDAKLLFDENEPTSVDDAITKMVLFNHLQTILRSNYTGSVTRDEDRTKELEAKSGLFIANLQRAGAEKSSDSGNQQNRMAGAKGAYIVPYLLYLRDNWAQKPQWMSTVPALPAWSEDDFYAKATAAWGPGKEQYDAAIGPFMEALTAALRAKDQAGLAQQQADRDAEGVRQQAEDAKAAEDANARMTVRERKMEEARKMLLQALNRPIPRANPPDYKDTDLAQPRTYEDEVFYRTYYEGKLVPGTAANGYIGGYEPATQEEIDAKLRAAVASHKNDPPAAAAPAAAAAPPAAAAPAVGGGRGAGEEAGGVNFAPFRYVAVTNDPFEHIKKRAQKMGRTARISTLDPTYFEGAGNMRGGMLGADAAANAVADHIANQAQQAQQAQAQAQQQLQQGLPFAMPLPLGLPPHLAALQAQIQQNQVAAAAAAPAAQKGQKRSRLRFLQGGNMYGSGEPEGDAIFRRIADEAYKSNPAQDIDGFKLFASSPTLKFYANGPDVVVGIRGTQDFTDAKADAAIVVGALENSQRFKTDLPFMQKIVSENPDKTFYGAGHSLGGAILDLFIAKGLIKSGKSFNAALQLGKEQAANKRIYNSGDALYKLSKPFLKQPLQVEIKKQSPLAQAFGLYNLYEQHKIGAGKRGREEPTAEEVAAAEARADRSARAARGEERLSSMEEQLNELSQAMFGKDADELDDDENDQLDVAFRRQSGDHEDEEDEEDEEDDRTEVILKGKRSGKKGEKRMARARRYMQKLKFPARIAQYKASLPFVKRRFNESMAARRADPDYDVPSDEDETDYEYDDDGAEEPPHFEPGTYFKRGGAMSGGATPAEKNAFLAKIVPLLTKFREDLVEYSSGKEKVEPLMRLLQAADRSGNEQAVRALEARLVPLMEAQVEMYKGHEKTFDEITRLISSTPANIADEASYAIKMYKSRDGVDLAEIMAKINEARRAYEVTRALLLRMKGGPDPRDDREPEPPTAEEQVNAMTSPEYLVKVQKANPGGYRPVMNPEEPYEY